LRQGGRPEASQEERQGKARPFPNAPLAQVIEGTDLMRAGNTLKRLRVDNYHQETGKHLGMTYLEFDKPKRVAPKGLR
jgi:hypothetical protein